MQLRGDIGNFEIIRQLLLRLSKSNESEKRALHAAEFDGGSSSQKSSHGSAHEDDDDWSEDPELDAYMSSWCWWSSDYECWVDEQIDEFYDHNGEFMNDSYDYFDYDYDDNSWYDKDSSWYDDEGTSWHDASTASEGGEVHWGKGKGKGSCSVCGTSGHTAKDCPGLRAGDGKGRGDGGKSGKGKGGKRFSKG